MIRLASKNIWLYWTLKLYLLTNKREFLHLFSAIRFLRFKSCPPSKEDLHRKLGIFVFPIVSDWTNVFIVTWLSDMCLLTIYLHEGDEVLLQFAKAKSQCLDWVKHFSIFMYLYTYQFVNILVIEILCNFCFFNDEIINLVLNPYLIFVM